MNMRDDSEPTRTWGFADAACTVILVVFVVYVAYQIARVLL